MHSVKEEVKTQRQRDWMRGPRAQASLLWDSLKVTGVSVGQMSSCPAPLLLLGEVRIGGIRNENNH